MNLNATLIVEVLSFLIFLGILNKLLYKPLLNMLDTRREEIKRLKEEAEASTKTAESYKEETEKIMRKTKQDILALREEARHEASQERLNLLKEAKAEAQRVMEHGRLEVFREAEQAKDMLKEEVLNLSIVMAEKILEKEIDHDAQKKLFIKSVDNLGHGG